MTTLATISRMLHVSTAARKSRAGFGRRGQESGFAYLMALFMVLLLLITSSAAVLNLRTDNRRRREEEMIWRGNQYVRAIRLYYRKSGHYPQTIEDLEKGLPELHFLRFAAYKDPVNKGGGDWRFIYVNAAGQIIGSVKYASLQQMALMDLNGGKLPTTTSSFPTIPSLSPVAPSGVPGQGTGSATGNQSGQSPVSPSTSAPSDAGSAQAGTPAQPGQPAQQTSQPAAGAPTIGNPLTQKPTGPVDGPVFGAFLTGVGSTVDQPSIKVYDGGTNYNQWEFIWNPIEDQARAVQQGLGRMQSPGLLGQPGATGIGVFTPGGGAAPGGAAPGSAQPTPQQIP